MTHTAGRWSWRESGSHYNIGTALGTIAVAFGESVTSNGGVTGVSGDEGEGNARLIAAAPDLLAALEAIAALPEGYCVCRDRRDAGKLDHYHEGECQAVRAAIAKAKA